MKNIKSAVQVALDNMFNKTKLNLVGPKHVPAQFVISFKEFDPRTTIGSHYVHAVSQNTVSHDAVNSSTLETLNNTTSAYLDKLKSEAQAKVDIAVDQHLKDAEIKAKISGTNFDDFLASTEANPIKRSLAVELQKIMGIVDTGVKRIVTTELTNAQNFGALDGILSMSQSIGIADPIIFKQGVIDIDLCQNCKSLWHSPNNINIPRTWKMSELKAGYFNRKDPQAVIGPVHPHCRHIMSMLSPGFGFDENGKIVYKGSFSDGTPWDEWEYQRNGKR